mmetsp:Transcript_56428/g.99117  ORF Transcript_56428/g.99117 Transcript_56428/m.99117 type:complete len:304 (+) Transcript_56428:520-1431(+)
MTPTTLVLALVDDGLDDDGGLFRGNFFLTQSLAHSSLLLLFAQFVIAHLFCLQDRSIGRLANGHFLIQQFLSFLFFLLLFQSLSFFLPFFASTDSSSSFLRVLFVAQIHRALWATATFLIVLSGSSAAHAHTRFGCQLCSCCLLHLNFLALSLHAQVPRFLCVFQLRQHLSRVFRSEFVRPRRDFALHWRLPVYSLQTLCQTIGQGGFLRELLLVALNPIASGLLLDLLQFAPRELVLRILGELLALGFHFEFAPVAFFLLLLKLFGFDFRHAGLGGFLGGCLAFEHFWKPFAVHRRPQSSLL